LRFLGAGGAKGIHAKVDFRGPVAVEKTGSFANWLAWDFKGRLIERVRGDLAMHWIYTRRRAR